MGFVKALETDQLTLPSDAAYWVRVKRRSQFGDHMAAQRAMSQLTDAGVPSGREWGAGALALAASMIIEWNLTDDNGPLPITIASIALLPPEDGQFLVTEVSNRAALRGVEQEGPFGLPPSNS